MRVAIIGGSGHIGSYLTPRLVECEHTVLNVSRSQRQPYFPHGAWERVEHVATGRSDEAFCGKIAGLAPPFSIRIPDRPHTCL